MIYLDNAATTPVAPEVLEAMQSCLALQNRSFANPTSLTHDLGRQAKALVDKARMQVAELIHADAKEIVWTSGATESINLALKGVAMMYQNRGKHIITFTTEHKAV